MIRRAYERRFLIRLIWWMATLVVAFVIALALSPLQRSSFSPALIFSGVD
jgi:hypothetical protein